MGDGSESSDIIFESYTPSFSGDSPALPSQLWATGPGTLASPQMSREPFVGNRTHAANSCLASTITRNHVAHIIPASLAGR